MDNNHAFEKGIIQKGSDDWNKKIARHKKNIQKKWNGISNCSSHKIHKI